MIYSYRGKEPPSGDTVTGGRCHFQEVQLQGEGAIFRRYSYRGKVLTSATCVREQNTKSACLDVEEKAEGNHKPQDMRRVAVYTYSHEGEQCLGSARAHFTCDDNLQ